MSASETDKLLHAIFTTAIEGGINYWANVESYRWETDGDDDYEGFEAAIADFTDDTLPEFEINLTVMRRGWIRARSGDWRNRLGWSSAKPPIVVNDALDDWDYDAGDADMIVQLGLFGDVIYG